MNSSTSQRKRWSPTEQVPHRRTRSSTTSTVARTVSPEVATTTRRSTRRRGMPPPQENAVDLTSAQAVASEPPEPPRKRVRTGIPRSVDIPQTSNEEPQPSTSNTQDLAAIALSDGEGDEQKEKIEEINLIDVDDADELNELLAKNQKDALNLQNNNEGKPKLAGFKCVICLDDPTDLSATPCGKFALVLPLHHSQLTSHLGHMFCDFCLRGALRAGQPPNAKSGRCPVCRRKVNLKDVVVLEIMKKEKPQGKGKAKAA
ncbi:hypothetical protein DFH27DRAFT_531335 [Peziza echinospora]|nr:hypothetical protein DFH27DRAFT_531335 [Peziza echinospora]